jgi:hypothetical protein
MPFLILRKRSRSPGGSQDKETEEEKKSHRNRKLAKDAGRKAGQQIDRIKKTRAGVEVASQR